MVEAAIFDVVNHLVPTSLQGTRIVYNQHGSKMVLEIDIFLPEYHIGIEYDGYYFHKGREVQDGKKNLILKSNDIKLVRIREYGLYKISEIDLVLTKTETLHILNHEETIRKVVTHILNQLPANVLNNAKIKEYIHSSIISYKPILNNLKKYSCLFSKSVDFLNPKLAQEWHPTKNGRLTPQDVSYGSCRKAWWLCSKNKNHEWEAQIKRRTEGNSCPYCAGQKVDNSNCLATINPQLAKEWHPTKNGQLTPQDVTIGADLEIWWICSQNNHHEWKSYLYSRSTGTSCPFCAGKKVDESNCLATVNSKLAKEWHPTKNGTLTARDVTSSSGKKVWWKCLKNNNHEWESTVDNRRKGNGCPYCSSKKVDSSNCLETINPQLTTEWHPIKNKLTPKDVTANSNRKAWWKCEKGHEWEANISNRNLFKYGCPLCRTINKTNNPLIRIQIH